MQQKKEKARTAAFLWTFLRPVLPAFLLAFVCLLLSTACSTLTPQVIRFAVDALTSGGNALPAPLNAWHTLARIAGNPGQALWLAAAGVLVTAALGGLFGYISQMAVATGSETALKAMRDRLFEHIQRLPYLWHSAHQTGDIIQRCTSDVDEVRNFLTGQLLEVFRTAVLVTFSLAMMFSMNVPITLISAAFLPALLMYSFFYYRSIARRFLAADQAEGVLSSICQENLTGVRVVRAFGRERYETDRFNDQNERFSSLWIHLGKLLSTYWGMGELVTGLMLVAVTAAGTLFAVRGTISLGELLAFISYTTTLAWPVRGLGRILSEMSKTGVSAGRLAYILDAEEETDRADAVEPPLTGDIGFHHVRYGFPGQQPVLRDIDFTIPAGSTFAILGGTGSGKSTLVHLINRLYDLPPESGNITIGGVDITHIRRAHLRRNIAMVLQEPFLFSRTVAENIRAVRPEAPLAEVREAARVAHVDHAVLDFPNGYDTMVGERGVTLSGGQKQRVAIARALMQDAPILIFDDSLSAVDTETDAQIRAALKEQTGRATVLLISHRITTLMEADRILVLENGRIAELGTHEELLRQGGLYKAIYDVQMGAADAPAEKETNYGV